MGSGMITVFDIGGTLMEYRNMPNVWLEYYQKAFEHVRKTLCPWLSDEDIAVSLDILRSYNPKVKYREVDYTPEKIFSDVTKHWKTEFELSKVIDAFFSSMKLTPYIYPETVSVLQKLKVGGHIIATLTDVATGMPDELHKSYFTELLPYFDLYVSSVSCGYRKPNPKGLRDIAEHFGAAADDMIFIGDEEKDIMTAKRFGCRSVLIDRKDKRADYGQDYTVSDLTGLQKTICNN